MNSRNSASMAIGTVDRKKSQIEDQLDALDEAIYQLSENADRLDAKLSSVTRQVEPAHVGAMATGPMLVPVAGTINELKCRVQNVSARLDSLFNRTEL